MATTTTAEVILSTLNPKDGKLSVRVQVTRLDDAADELSKPNTVEEHIDLNVPDLSTINVTVGSVTMAGDDVCKLMKKLAQKAVRKAYNGKPGAIASAINALDANG